MGMNFNPRGAVGGAASGAGAGAAFGPWGAAIGAGVGGVAGGFLTPDDSALAKEIAKRNAVIFNQAGEASLAKGEAEAARVQGQAVRMMARAKVAMISKGVAGEGVGDVLKGMAINAETDAETVRNNAAREAWGYRNQAVSAAYDGEAATARADQVMISSILGGASTAASSYATWKRAHPSTPDTATATGEG
jgi:hypothetical protein